MDATVIITILLAVLLFAALGAAVMLLRSGSQGSAGSIRDLMPGPGAADSGRKRPGEDQFLDIDEIKLRSGHSQLRRQKEDINQKLFKAGV